MSETKFRRVNSLLDKQPNLGPFPADMIFPWAAISLSSFLIFKTMLQLSWIWFGSITAWGCATWWILTAKNSWQYLSKFITAPHWVRAISYYQSPLETNSKVRHHGKNRHKKLN